MKTMIFFLLLTLSLLSITFQSIIYAESEIELFPTDDAYVLADLLDSADNNELRKFNSGALDTLKIGYALNTSDIPNQNISVALLKFDLGDLDEKQIESATLQLYADQLQLSKPQNIGVFFVNGSTWNESTLTYENIPSVSNLITTTMLDSVNYYTWNLEDVVKQNSGKQISLMLSFVTLLPNTEDVIIFASKDAPSPDHIPKLIIKVIPDNPESNIVKITPIDDTFIGLDLSTLDDSFDLRNSNFGNVDFIKVWYSNNATPSQELITTSGLLKFDLSEIDVDDIKSVNLKMKTLRIDSSGADKILSISKLNNTSWNESEITFNNHPPFELHDSFLAEMTQPDSWHVWNITSAVKENTDSKLSLSVSYSNSYPEHEEQTVFYSKESQFPPYLEITLKEKEGGGCLIATATYGSELAPQVQQLRELRDNHLLQTESGTIFMSGFNQFYYSFSPIVSDLERESPIFKELVRLSITPLVSSLSLLTFADLNSEFSVLGYGVSIITLNIGMYFVSPVIGMKIIRMLFFTKKEGRFL